MSRARPKRLDLTAVEPTDVPRTLAGWHRTLPEEAQVTLVLPGPFGSGELGVTPADVVVGAGFGVALGAVIGHGPSDHPDPGAEQRAPRGHAVAARRVTSLPDVVSDRMAVLFCGLNPSLHAARSGVPYSGPNNRFWPAAVAAGLFAARPAAPADDEFDATDDAADSGAVLPDRPGPAGAGPVPALDGGDGRIGFTDVVKRATARASDVPRAEFQAGFGRVERLVGWLRPDVVCFVGLGGYRAGADRRTAVGWQPRQLGGVATYVMPSTSGLNAATSLAALTEHLRQATARQERRRR